MAPVKARRVNRKSRLQLPPPPGCRGTVTFTDGDSEGTITLNGIRRIESAEGPIGGEPASGSYLVADFTVAFTEGSGSANPLGFRAQGPDGTTYDSELGVLEQQIDSAEIPAGRQVRGEVAFDAPVGELLLDYSAPLGGPLATFAVNG